jgi:hypothetical protein
MTSLKSSRKHGGQPGNRNALKHALYAKHYPDETRKVLAKWELSDYAAEIQLLRVTLDKLAQDVLAPNPDSDRLIKQVTAMSIAVDSLVNASKQHMLFNSADSPTMVAWTDTLLDHEFFKDGESPE